MMSRNRRVAFARAAMAALGLASMAAVQAADPTPAERAIEYRQAVFKVVAGNFGPLAQAAQGKVMLQPQSVRQYGERLAAVADFARDAFPPISSEGKTRARPEIWSDRASFDQLVNEFGEKTRALAAVAARADAGSDEFKSAVGAVGNTCKGCHDKFRAR